jgi:hypothetical protein
LFHRSQDANLSEIVCSLTFFNGEQCIPGSFVGLQVGFAPYICGMKLIPIVFLCLVSLLFLGNATVPPAHPFYVSVTEIRSDSKAKTFTLSVRMFTDDIQSALFKRSNYRGELNDQDGSANEVLTQYIAERLSITVEGKAVAFKFIGYETEDEATWSHLEATEFPGTGKIAVTNRLLFDYIEGQTNIVHCYRDGERSSYKLVKPEVATSF